MSGGNVHLRVEGTGEEYDMPEDVAMQAMYDLDKAGKKWSVDVAPSKPEAPRAGGVSVYSEPDPNLKVEPPDPGLVAARAGHPMPSQEEQEHVLTMLRDPLYFGKNLAKTGANYIGGAIAGAGEGAGVIMNAGRQGVGAGIARGINAYLDDPKHDLLNALVEGGKGFGEAGLLALGLGGAGRLASAGGDRARVASFGGDKQDLAEIGVTPREFAQRTDELGLNNSFVPMDRADKLARVQGALTNAGDRQTAAIANADRAGIGANRDWGAEIARDVDMNADRVRVGGSGQRDAIMDQMGKVAGAAEAAENLDSLAGLRSYKTGRASEAYADARGGLNESAAGKAALAASDSATQHLDRAMEQSGPQNYGAYKQANADFGDASVLQEMLEQAPRTNPLRRTVGTAAGAAIGGLAGGAPGAVVGAAANELTRPYQMDALANTATGIGRNLGAASEVAGMATAQGAGLKQAISAQTSYGQGRGNMQGQAAQDLLKQNPNAFGQWTDQVMQAVQDGTIDQLIVKLNRDPEFRMGPGMQLRQMTAEGR